jgi:hypothetical protein
MTRRFQTQITSAAGNATIARNDEKVLVAARSRIEVFGAGNDLLFLFVVVVGLS